MNIEKLLKEIKISESPNFVEIYSFAEELGIDIGYDYKEQERLIHQMIGDWYCTDTIVGY